LRIDTAAAVGERGEDIRGRNGARSIGGVGVEVGIGGAANTAAGAGGGY